MHPCRACGKAVETAAQFCPWCFTLPAESHVRADAIVTPLSTTWGGAPVPSRWPRLLLVAGIVAIVVALLVGVFG